MATFLAKNVALVPLFVAVGLGLGGGIGFGIHYLKNNQDVVLRKKSNPDPWNKVPQDNNTKLFSFNPDFWRARAQLTDPRLSFMESKPENERTLHEQAMVERAKQIRMNDKERTIHS
ncbi:hypothetical protein BY996DRAFT_6409554 [Phakopsora pachyrhizi]|uniref:NADH dehydrogenase [ubiquinone] 1 alpha subcomplex subunit 4 n=1 Tax=Phakopsora pachyrhizi TaxID=170000 RepID=A0A0S1MIU6_PHAPC|nr:hypothetical protein BY996DRAFT_6409554 [Phakopsora pachyrhizi]CAH7685026.1 hypothetical protein PPACK8108_LOCUS19495 [Phakopsora pachyrhizi]